MEPSRAMLSAVANLRLRAASYGVYNGQPTPQNMQLIQACSLDVPQGLELFAHLAFTRDEGMHSSGWWKNADYQRCYHLSLSFREMGTFRAVPHEHKRAAVWCDLFYGYSKRYLWIEPPFSPEGKKVDVYHYRLFMEPDWTTPKLPRGEVYSREFTELGWKSWSEVQGVDDLLGEVPP